MRDAVIVEAVRTPVGKRNGGLAGVHAGRPVLARPDGAGRAQRHRPGPGRGRHLGLRQPGRRADPRHRPHRAAGRGLAGDGARHDRRPAVRFLPAGDQLRGRLRDRRAVRRRRGRRCGVDEPGADGIVRGRRRARHAVQRRLPGPVQRRVPEPGHRRGDDRRAVGPDPDAAGRVQSRLARQGRRGAGRGPVRRPDRRRHRARRHQGARPTKASAGAARSRRWVR